MEEEKKTRELQETEAVPINNKIETAHFPWAVAIIIGVLMLLVIICFVVVMILGPGDPVTSSSQISASSL